MPPGHRLGTSRHHGRAATHHKVTKEATGFLTTRTPSTERLHLNTLCAHLPTERPYGAAQKQIAPARPGADWSVGSTCFTPVPPQPTDFLRHIDNVIKGSVVIEGGSETA